MEWTLNLDVLKKEEVMKFKKILLMTGLIFQAAAFAMENNQDNGLLSGFINIKSASEEIADEFIPLNISNSVIIETLAKATPAIDWQIELYNDSRKTAFVALINKSKGFQILPDPDDETTRVFHEFMFYPLQGKKFVRIAGINPDHLLRLVVIDDIEGPDQAWSYQESLEAILQQGQIRTFTIKNDGKSFFQLDEEFNLKRVFPSAVQTTTKSGISLIE